MPSIESSIGCDKELIIELECVRKTEEQIHLSSLPTSFAQRKDIQKKLFQVFFFSFHFKRFAQLKCFYKKLRVPCDIQKWTITLHSSNSKQRIQYI